MFRTTSAALLHLFLSTVAIAASGPPPDLHGDTRYPGDNKAANLIARDHVQTQLDWRSYYLNRMAVRRHELLQFGSSWQQPTQAGAR